MNQDIYTAIQKFFEPYPERKFAKRQVIVQAGDEPAGVFYIVSGRVSQYDIAPGGTEVVVNVFKPPAFFPLSWAINKTPNLYFFEATTDVVLKQAPAEEAVAFLRSEPAVLFDLLSRVYRGTDGLLRRLAHTMGGDARSRLLFSILNAGYRFGDQAQDGVVHVPLNEGDLAKHSGLARETVSRIMQDLKAASLVEITSTGLTIKDLKALEAELGSNL